MGNLNQPEMSFLKNGKKFKILNIKAKRGMKMPMHHSTKEAVIVVLKGEATLKMPDVDHNLFDGTTFIIPEMVEHSLKVERDFFAFAIMENDSEIEFEV
ncbi:MAG: cupin [Aequorivita sp.]